MSAETNSYKKAKWHSEDEQNLNACLGYIPDEFLRRWLKDVLMKAMSDTGWEFDFNKKELKKIESKKLDVWNAEDEQNLNVVLSFIEDECLRRWLKDKLCYDKEDGIKILDADKVIEWLKNTIREVKERYGNYGVYYDTQLVLPYNSIEDFINDFKEDFGLC